MSIKLTRQELYDRVWTTPAVQLAREYGISDVMIAQICRQHRIPNPPWATGPGFNTDRR
jgi:hypothetical protein